MGKLLRREGKTAGNQDHRCMCIQGHHVILVLTRLQPAIIQLEKENCFRFGSRIRLITLLKKMTTLTSGTKNNVFFLKI